MRFAGREARNVSRLELHSHERHLNVSDARIRCLSDLARPPSTSFAVTQRTQDIAVFTLPSPFFAAPGSIHRMKIAFWISTNYRQSFLFYRDDVMYTHLALRSARRLFPCFDEPKYRSLFLLAIKVSDEWASPDMSAVSNGAGSRFEDTWRFDPTPPMPTYLLAFAIGRLQSFCQTRIRPSGWVKRACIHYPTSYSAIEEVKENLTSLALDAELWLEDFTDLPNWQKLDFFIAPWLDGFGGMENWGLISLYGGLDFRSGFRARINHRGYLTLVHEVAHYWFGNVVSPESWAHGWLSEGLATFVSKYMLRDLYSLEGSTEALKYSGRRSLLYDRQVVVDETWREGLGSVLYQKGACISMLIARVLGFDRFRDFIRSYFREFQGSSVSTFTFASFLGAFGNSSELLDMVISFTTQASHPNVHVGFDEALGQFHLYQRSSEEGSLAQWTVPVWTVTEAANSSCGYLGGLVSCRHALHDPTNATLHWLRPKEHLVISPRMANYTRIRFIDAGCYSFR